MHTNDKIRRFSIYRIIEHLLLFIIVSCLILTGFIQKFYTSDIATWIIVNFGGIDITILVHRCIGILLIILFLQHIFFNVIAIIYYNMEFSMLINKDDFHNFIKDFKYYMGKTNNRAENDRYTYRQKFEYWGVFVSISLLALSGIILWFPTFFTAYFPGLIIPIAKIVHFYQAIILLIIIISHIYNAIFNPDVIPLDSSIITGYLSRERYIKEHLKEYKRKIKEKRTKD